MFDGQLVRPPSSFLAAAENYVCVRIVNINDVDLNVFGFDYDLTLAVVLGHPDGTVYHRYGGRDRVSPMAMETLLDLLREGLKTHEDYLAHPRPPATGPPQHIHELIEARLSEQIKPSYGCYHCHYVREARQYLALEAGQWTPDQFWIWPSPERLGLVMQLRRQNEVKNVLPGSAAERAGFAAGDVVNRLQGKRILTQYDIQGLLQETPGEAVGLSFERRREERLETGTLSLEATWKVGDPEEYQWRVRNVFTEHMVKFLPAPGFVGRRLRSSEMSALGLAGRSFGLKVTQLNYGTYLAGIRMGDVILSAGDRSEFSANRDFYEWCERQRRLGRDLKMELFRQDAIMNVMVSLNYLNYSRVEKAPRVKLGFIVQELPADEGLRVGHVADDSSAEKTGLRLGDRIVSVDGQEAPTRQALEAILSDKSPGDLLALEVTRGVDRLSFGFVLPGEEELRSELAILSEAVRAAGQELRVMVRINLPPGEHIYSMHRRGFGSPTRLEFRGRGFELVDETVEPPPKKIDETELGLEPMWILEGRIELRQTLRVTDPAQFFLALRVYAQVCDDRRCHEFSAIVSNNGKETDFTEFRGNFERQPALEP